jgi:hypothetical protein
VQLVHFVNSILLLNHLNRVAVIAAGVGSCAYIFDSSDASAPGGGTAVAATFGKTSHKMEEFISQDAHATTTNTSVHPGSAASLLSGALSLALCCILWFEFLHICLSYFLAVLLNTEVFRYTENLPVWDAASPTSGECAVVFMLATVLNTMEGSASFRHYCN